MGVWMLTRQDWSKEQAFEADWWGDCCNTFGEELKQLAYARVMGIYPGDWRGGDHWPVYDFGGTAVLDVGGGPNSMLLKADNFTFGVVVDPCSYPQWVSGRYAIHDIVHRRELAEDELPRFQDQAFDIALIYNVLQHTLNPERIVREMTRVAKRIHLFEWVDTPPHPGHPHTLRSEDLASWLPAGEGRHVWLDEQYKEIRASSRSVVRQHAWGGRFGS